MKCKIKIVTKGNYPYGGAGSNYVRNLAKALYHQEYDVQVILTSGNVNIPDIESDDTLKGIRYVSLRSIHSIKSISLFKILNSISDSFNIIIYLIKLKLRKDIDVIFNYDIFFSSAIIMWFLTKILGIKLIYILPEFYSKLTMNKIKYYDFVFGIKCLASFSDGLIVLSTYMQDYFKVKKKYKRPILLVPNIIELREFKRENIKPYIKGKITIGYAGTPTDKDGIKDLLLSYSILAKENSNIHLLIVGDTTTGSTVVPELKRYAKELKINNQTSFTGLIPFCSVPDLLLSCDILTLTRNTEITSLAGFPTKLGEYFACKKPVLITKVGDMVKYFTDGIQVVLSEPGNIKSIVEGFERLIKNFELSNLIALNGYRWAQENLEYKKVSLKVQKWLETEIFPQ